jgi:hypothetical protein
LIMLISSTFARGSPPGETFPLKSAIPL